MQLRDIAHSRTDDRGVLVNVSVIAFDARDYPHLERIITADRVREHLAGLVQRTVVRYAWPHLGALSFMVWPVGSTAITRALAPDARGKSISDALLHMDVPEFEGEAALHTVGHGSDRLHMIDRFSRLPVG
jgi:hypothetical protein